jgi:hypothetical protein
MSGACQTPPGCGQAGDEKTEHEGEQPDEEQPGR